MNDLELKKYFPAGGRANEELEITHIDTTKREDVLVGKAVLPLSRIEKKVVIYRLDLQQGNSEYRVIPAACPHQGADISQDALKVDGNVYCSLHRRPICVFSEYNQAYKAEKRGDRFFIVKTS